MGAVLTTGSQLRCAHGGTVSVGVGRAALTVGGRPVLARADVVGRPVSGCSTPSTSSSKPCTTVTSLVAGEATTLTAGGQAVLLASAQGLTDGVPPGTWSVGSAGHALLEAT